MPMSILFVVFAPEWSLRILERAFNLRRWGAPKDELEKHILGSISQPKV